MENDRLLIGRKEICRACGEPEKRIGRLVRQGLRAWKVSAKSNWRCLQSDALEFVRAQRDHYLRLSREK